MLTLVWPVIPIPIPIWLPALVFIDFTAAKDALLGQLVLEAYKAGQYLPLGIGVFARMGGLLGGGMIFIYLFVHPPKFLPADGEILVYAVAGHQ